MTETTAMIGGVDALTDHERARLTGGAGPWLTVAVQRLHIPQVKLTDGMVGARGDSFTGPTSLCVPCGPALAASWDPELVRRVGQALAEDARTKRASVLLAPVLNLHRHPLSGRNFEAFSEDPLLAACIGVGYIRGVQDRGVAAVAKHFVANDAEVDREHVECHVDEPTLREVYLVPFEAAVREAGVWAVMSAYNKLNGIYCSEHAWLLTEVLRQDWGFDGVVVSDWGATHSAQALLAGLDLEMPGPPRHLGDNLTSNGSDEDEAIRGALERSSTALLRLLERTSAAMNDPTAEETADERPEHRAIAHEAARRGIVLLVNDGTLPLADADSNTTIAVVGALAASTPIQGGGSATVNPHRTVSVLEGVREATARSGAQVQYANGPAAPRYAPALDATMLCAADGTPGMSVVYSKRSSGEVVGVAHLPTTSLISIGPPAPAPMADLLIHASAEFNPVETGTYTFGLMSAGHARVSVDSTLLLDSRHAPIGGAMFFGRGTQEIHAGIELTAGVTYQLEVTVEPIVEKSETVGFMLGAHAPQNVDLIVSAVELAQKSDVAVVVVGTGPDWETEGGDRSTLALPGRQDELIRRVAAVNQRTVVVLVCGAPVATPWISEVSACLVLWFGGQEAGHAVADILFGIASPSGRLPVSFPANDTQLPELGLTDGVMQYAEGHHIGYRYHLRAGHEPAFPFGHGYTYTTFSYSQPRAIAIRDGYVVHVTIANTGERAGAETVQLYVRDACDGPMGTARLAAFAQCEIAPRDQAEVELLLGHDALRRWDAVKGVWYVPCRNLEVLIGASATDIRSSLPLYVGDQV